LPNQYATAQRITNIEAYVGPFGGRIASPETVTSDGRFATASRVSNLEATAGNLSSRVAVSEGAIVGLGVRQAAYWRVEAVACTGALS
jgi:predicted dinucleotide-utilizing enzyme